MRAKGSWSQDPENKITITHRLLAGLSLKTRKSQFEIFWRLLKPTPSSKVLDVGVRADETLSDSNFFEKKYPHPEKLTVASVEDCQELFKKQYSKIKFIKIKPGEPLLFANKSFDLVVSWATLEHVGEAEEQKFFLQELFRVGKKIFITTPDKACFYEPHSGLIFLHWLPDRYFQLICRLLGKRFWADKKNLNPLTKADIGKILPEKKGVKILSYKMFGFIPSHLIIAKY